jgi:hypothetical protein
MRLTLNAIGIWILPWRTESGEDLPDAHRSNTILETDAI